MTLKQMMTQNEDTVSPDETPVMMPQMPVMQQPQGSFWGGFGGGMGSGMGMGSMMGGMGGAPAGGTAASPMGGMFAGGPSMYKFPGGF